MNLKLCEFVNWKQSECSALCSGCDLWCSSCTKLHCLNRALCLVPNMATTKHILSVTTLRIKMYVKILSAAYTDSLMMNNYLVETCRGQSNWNKLLIKCVHHVGLSYTQVTPAVATAVKLIVGVERWTYGAICDNYGIVEHNLYSGPILTENA